LVDRDEKGYGKLCGLLSYLSKSKNKTPEAGRPVAAITHFDMEMGSYYYGFRSANVGNS